MRRRGPAAAWMVAVVLAASPAACGRDATTGRSAPSAAKGLKVGLVFDLGGRGDGSYNDAAAAGLDRAAEELGVEGRTVTAGRNGENREELLRLLASEKYGLVFAVGFTFAGPVAAVAKDFRHVSFGIVDAPVPAPNVLSVEFASEQGAYLVDVAAARKSRTGKLGFLGGVETDAVRRFEIGFAAGARRVRPDAQIAVSYLTQPPDLNGFADPARAREVPVACISEGSTSCSTCREDRASASSKRPATRRAPRRRCGQWVSTPTSTRLPRRNCGPSS